MVSVTVLSGSTTVVDTETAGGGVVGVGSFGAGAGSLGVTASAAGAGVLEAEVDVAGVDEGAGVVDAVDGVCVVVAVDVVPPAAGGVVADVEPDEWDEAFGAGAGLVLTFDARAALTGTTAALARQAAASRRCAFAVAREGGGVVARDCVTTAGGVVGWSTAGRGASRLRSWPTAGNSWAIATVRSTAADARRYTLSGRGSVRPVAARSGTGSANAITSTALCRSPAFAASVGVAGASQVSAWRMGSVFGRPWPAGSP
jgi:hypothetical protein